MNAAMRSFRILAPGGLYVYGVPLPPGEDPDSFIRSRGKEDFMMLLDQGDEIPTFLADKQLPKGQLGNLAIEDRMHRIEAVLDAISLIPDSIRQSYYIRDLASRLGIPERHIAARLQQKDRATPMRDLRIENIVELDRLKADEKSLLVMVAASPGLMADLKVHEDWLSQLDVYSFLEELDSVDYSRIGDVIHQLSEPLREFLTKRSEPSSADLKPLLRRLKKYAWKKKLTELDRRLQEYGDGLKESERNEILRQKNALAKEYYNM